MALHSGFYAKRSDPESRLTDKKAIIEVILHSSQSQSKFNQTIKRLKTEFRGTRINTVIKTRKLVPIDVIVELVVQVSALLLYDVVKKLTTDFSNHKIPQRLDFETRYNLAQSYMLRNGIRQFKLKKKTDHGDASSFTFVDKKKNNYSLKVGSDGSVSFKTSSQKQ